MKHFIMILILLISATGCTFRTAYLNVKGDKGPKMTLEQFEKLPDYEATKWRHYFLNGLLPSERTFNATEECGSKENLLGIATRQSALQNLVAAVTTVYYVFQIYTPYDGRMVCDRSKMPAIDVSKTQTEDIKSNATNTY